MRGSKNAVWKNDLGQCIYFDNYRFFLEAIDMISVPGIHTTESLAMADGVKTIRHQLGAKTIPCSFAFKNTDDDGLTGMELAQIFSPLRSGVLRVYTENAEYMIECSIQDEPTFVRDTDNAFRWNVDFVADFPYWKMDTKKIKAVSDIPFAGLKRVLLSDCPFDIMPEIVFPASDDSVLFQLYPQGSTSKGFTLKAHPDYPVRVITQDFKVIRDDTKEDCSQLIDATAELDEICIRYGKNVVTASPAGGVTLEYYRLSMGEV